jgi:methylmalonyl-CoA/ethylmalonyl-CoA epimerase
VPEVGPKRTPHVPSCFTFHHIGYACTSIAAERSVFEMLGYQLEGSAFTDPTQGVAGCFMAGSGPRIELLENLPGSHTLTPWLETGAKLYHMAYEVEGSLEDALPWVRRERARVIMPPTPAVAFSGRWICFVMFRRGLLIELIGQPSTAGNCP